MSLFKDAKERELALFNLSIVAWHARLTSTVQPPNSPPSVVAQVAFDCATAFLAEAERRIKGPLT